jgi:DNA-binding transcriptional regulator GbsR (MarR family)
MATKAPRRTKVPPLTPRRRVMALLWKTATPMSAAEIARKLDMTGAQVGSVLRPLVLLDIVSEVGTAKSADGHRVKTYAPQCATTTRDAA